MKGMTEHLRPDDGSPLPEEDFARTAGLAREQVRELLDYGLLGPARLDLRMALALREAGRLQQDFDLDLFATGLLAGYIARVHALQSELDRARAEHPASAVFTEVSYTAVTVRRGP